MRKKAISLLLISSLLLSVSGCSFGAKKQILQTVEGYADAVLKGDAEDIAEYTKYEDEYCRELELYKAPYTFDEDLNEIYDLVLGSMTYKIDKGSVRIDKDTATVDITYTLIDYWDIYKDLDEDADTKDYLEALEEGSDNTTDIDQTVELVLKDDEWKIYDADNENILEVYEFYSEIFECGLIPLPEISTEDMTDEIESSFNVTLADYNFYDGTDYSNVYYYGEHTYIDIYIYNDPEDALGYYSAQYLLYMATIYNMEFTGLSAGYLGREDGFILLNGNSSSASFYSDQYVYGGIYLRGDTCIVIVTTEDSDSAREEVELILEDLGLPAPTR